VEVIRSSGQIADRARFQHGSMDAYWSGPNGFLTYHVTMY
jgi:hypothetical protein